MDEKDVKKLPAFDHIKVLQDGNFGCTLCVEEKIYNGIFTPNWECIEKLHLVEVDAYKDYDYTLKDGLNPMLDKEKIDIDYDTDEELAKGLILNFEEDTKEDEKENPLALFISQYGNSNGDIALSIDNTLLPYIYFIPSFLENIFFKFACCGCSRLFASTQLCWNKIRRMFGVSLFSNDNPFDNALKQVIKEYQTLDDLAFDIVDEKYPDVDVADPQFEENMWDEMEKLEASFRERLADGAYDFCYYGYLQYLKDSCSDLLDDLP